MISKISLFLLVTSLALTSCLEPKEYSDIPEITFESFQILDDTTAYLSIGFTDGDGDVGLTENDTYPPFDTSSQFHYNLFLTYYEKVNGGFQVGKNTFGDEIKLNYRVPDLTPRGQNKALKGVIRVHITPAPFYNPGSADSDTILFEIQLADRSLNLSNTIRTEEIIR